MRYCSRSVLYQLRRIYGTGGVGGDEHDTIAIKRHVADINGVQMPFLLFCNINDGEAAACSKDGLLVVGKDIGDIIRLAGIAG